MPTTTRPRRFGTPPKLGATMELEGEALRWWQRRVGVVGGKAMTNVAKLEGYDELMGELVLRLPLPTLRRIAAQLPAKALAALPAEKLAVPSAEKRLAGLSPEERLAGPSVREVVAGLGPAGLAALRTELARAPAAGAKPKPRRRKASR
jgi:hypothetical protein